MVSGDLLKPYRAGQDGPWKRPQAAHLLRRAGFRADERTIRAALSDGPIATVERLTTDQPESPRFGELDPLGERLAQRDDILPLAGWWLARMAHTANPLRARMALFWHNHFATSHVKVRNPALMLAQLRTIEAHSLGPFAGLLLAVARDPAMIIWLDGDSNNKGRPNENFARELLELFTLGVGHYGERDIREIARAFTGWHQRRGRFVLDRSEHDDGEKEVFGQRGPFDGTDIIPLLLRQKAAAGFLARKLVREFIADEVESPAMAALVDALAATLRDTDFDLRRALRTLLGSRAMFMPEVYRARVSSPVEFIVGTARALQLRIDMPAAARAAGEMGQRLFEPPTVKGWEGGRAWINSATMLARMNAAAHGCGQRDDGAGFDAHAFAQSHEIDDADAALRFLCELLLDGQPPDCLRTALCEATAGAGVNDALRTAARMIVASPEYQLV